MSKIHSATKMRIIEFRQNCFDESKSNKVIGPHYMKKMSTFKIPQVPAEVSYYSEEL